MEIFEIISRWEVIDVVRTLSTEKVKAGEEGSDSFKFSRFVSFFMPVIFLLVLSSQGEQILDSGASGAL